MSHSCEQLDDADRLVLTVVPIRGDEAVALAPGEELLISYQGDFTPLEAFLKFGFVADAWWEAVAAPAGLDDTKLDFINVERD